MNLLDRGSMYASDVRSLQVRAFFPGSKCCAGRQLKMLSTPVRDKASGVHINFTCYHIPLLENAYPIAKYFFHIWTFKLHFDDDYDIFLSKKLNLYFRTASASTLFVNIAAYLNDTGGSNGCPPASYICLKSDSNTYKAVGTSRKKCRFLPILTFTEDFLTVLSILKYSSVRLLPGFYPSTFSLEPFLLKDRVFHRLFYPCDPYFLYMATLVLFCWNTVFEH